jgi:hypothetical protein
VLDIKKHIVKKQQAYWLRSYQGNRLWSEPSFDWTPTDGIQKIMNGLLNAVMQ